MKKVNIGGKIHTVLDENESNDLSNYGPDKAVIIDEQYVLPVYNRPKRSAVGVYYGGKDSIINRIVKPSTEEDKEKYSVDNIVDLQTATTYNGLVEEYNRLHNSETYVPKTMKSGFKGYYPETRANDSLIMKTFKKAVSDKNVDISEYRSRFASINNDLRLMSAEDITLKKLTEYCNVFDIKVKIELSNKNDSVANPLSKPYECIVTDNDEHYGYEDDNYYEDEEDDYDI